MLLRLSFGLEKEASIVENAVQSVLNQGYRTKDIAAEGEAWLSTTEMVEKVKETILQA
jgi:3-isopropylmalate dehydrogenase